MHVCMHVCMYVCLYVADQLYLPVRPRLTETTFQLSLYIYRLKLSGKGRSLTWETYRQKWKLNDHIKRHIWSVCRNTDNDEYGFVHFSSMTSNFSTMLESKYKIWRLKLPKWTKYLFNTDITTFSGLWGSMEKDFFTESQLCIWKKVRQSRNQNDRRTYAETCHSPTLYY